MLRFTLILTLAKIRVMKTGLSLLLTGVLVTAMSLAIPVYSQTNAPTGFIYKGFYMGFIPSADQSKLAYYERREDDKFNFAVLGLTDFSVRKMEAFNAGGLIGPDMKSQYWVDVISNNNLNPANPNFSLYYSSDGSLANRKIYPGTWHPFGFLSDGTAVAGDISFYYRGAYHSIKNLRIVDPNTGTEIKSLMKGDLFTPEESLNGGKHIWHLVEKQSTLFNFNMNGIVKAFSMNGKPGTK